MNADSYKDFVRDNCPWVENKILSGALKDIKFYSLHCADLINKKSKRGELYSDFSKPVDNFIYNELHSYYSSLNTLGEIEPISQVSLKNLLIQKLEERLIPETDSVTVSTRLKELYEEDLSENFLQILVQMMTHWLEIRRVRQVISGHLSQKTLSNDVITEIRDSVSGTSRNEGDYSIDDIMQGYEEENEEDDRFLTGVKVFDKGLPSGLRKGESGIFLASPGGGKTIMACQLASGLALTGKKVLFVTTEQPPNELLPRFVSCQLGIDFSDIADGIKLNKIREKHGEDRTETVKSYLGQIKENIRFKDWKNQGASIAQGIDPLIEGYRESGFNFDVLIFDWLGGGLGDIPDNMIAFKRNLIANSNEAISKAALSHELAIILTYQLDDNLSLNVKYPTSKHVSEYKMVHQPHTWALAVSKIVDEDKTADRNAIKSNMSSVYSKYQNFNWFKVRKGDPPRYEVVRNFKYQRFDLER